MNWLRILLSTILILSSWTVEAASRKKKESTDELSRDAYVWGYPAVLMSQVKKAMLANTKDPQTSINHFRTSPKTPDPFLSPYLTVNPENLYSWAWVDLSNEPLVMTHPAINDRFYSIQLVDAYSNVFQTISNDNQGDRPGTFVITPPGWKGHLPENTTQIRASTPEIFILAQAFVLNLKDTAQLTKILSQRHLVPLSAWNKGVRIDSSRQGYPENSTKLNKNLAANGLEFYQELQEVIAKNAPVTKSDEQELARLTPLGLSNKAALLQFMSLDENRKSMERGLFEGERNIQSRLASGFGPKINGWSYELKSPPFTEDYLLRAATAQRYLFSTPAAEITHMTLDADSESRQLFSSYRYVLHFETEDFPPSQNMWSLKVYEMKNKNTEELARPIATINDRTAKFKYNMDGSVDILFQNAKPPSTYLSNWVPLSKNANFYLVLTMFNPSNTVLNRKYIAPSLTRIDEESVPKQRVTRTMLAEAHVSK